MTIVKLSIIIPAFNEQNRLPPTLHRLFRYLPGLGCSYEIIVADDGSIDQTAELVRQLQNQNNNLVLVSDGINRGRGEAVRIGVSKAQGDLILVTDADGSVADEAIGRFVAAFDSDAELQAVFGSREMRGAVILGAQPSMRWLLGKVFIYLSRLLFSLWHVTDFTLGFKMFRLAAARDIFAHQYDPFFLAEAELVYVAHIRRHRNIQLPVAWTDSSDSKVNPLRDVGRSLIGLLQILYRRFTGMYGLA